MKKYVHLSLCCILYAIQLSATNRSSLLKDTSSGSSFLTQNFRVGLSIGGRYSPRAWNPRTTFREAYINPLDSTLQFSSLDHGAVILSAGLMAYPFLDEEWYTHFGFIANLNLASFGDGDVSSIFNRRIEGGIGFAFSCNQYFSVSVSYETYNQRSLREDYDRYTGKKLYVDGATISNLDDYASNSSLFKDDYQNAWSIKFIYEFGKNGN